MREFILAYDLNTVEPFTAYVIEDIMDNIDDNPNYIAEVLEYGCQSGVVSSLTYYCQTRQVFKQFYEEILEIYDEVKNGVNIEVNANNLVWLAYEHVCSIIYNEYQLEVRIWEKNMYMSIANL